MLRVSVVLHDFWESVTVKKNELANVTEVKFCFYKKENYFTDISLSRTEELTPFHAGKFRENKRKQPYELPEVGW